MFMKSGMQQSIVCAITTAAATKPNLTTVRHARRLSNRHCRPRRRDSAREAAMPDVGIVELQDAETGRKAWVDTSSARVREHYAENWRERDEAVGDMLRRNRIDTAMISTEGDYVAELIKLFKQR